MTTPLPPGLTITPHAITSEHSAALQHWLQHDTAIPWEHSIEGRRVAQFGVRYDYHQQCVDLTPVLPLPKVLRQWLPNVTSEFTQCIINEYAPNDAIPFHTDAPLFGPNILVFCLGEARPLLLQRHLEQDQPKIEFSASIEHRWSYQMSGEARDIWQHAVPAGVGRRVSITFRSLVPGALVASQKLSRFVAMEMEVAHAKSKSSQMHNLAMGRKEQLDACEKANGVLVERIQRMERGQKAFVAKERTWKRERSELRLENNKLAQQLLDLEQEVVNFMNSKGLMEGSDGHNEGSRGNRTTPRKSRKKNKKHKKKEKKKKKKSHSHVDHESEDICQLCGHERGTCVHTKTTPMERGGGSGGGGGVGGGVDGGVGGGSGGGGGGSNSGYTGSIVRGAGVALDHASSDDSDAAAAAPHQPIEGKRNSKRRQWKKHKGEANNDTPRLNQETDSANSDSEAEEARMRGGKVATSPHAADNNVSSLTKAVNWAGSLASSTMASAAWVLGAGGEEEEDSDGTSDYSIDSDASRSDLEHARASSAALTSNTAPTGPSLGRNMLYLKQKTQQQQRRQGHQQPRKTTPKPVSPANAAAAASARRIKRGQGVSDALVQRGTGIAGSRSTIQAPTNMQLGVSATMKKSVIKSVVRRGGGTAVPVVPKQLMKTVVRGKGSSYQKSGQ